MDSCLSRQGEVRTFSSESIQVEEPSSVPRDDTVTSLLPAILAAEGSPREPTVLQQIFRVGVVRMFKGDVPEAATTHVPVWILTH